MRRILFFIFSFLSFSSCCSYTDIVPLSFEHLFPETVSDTILEGLMHVQHACETQLLEKHADEYDMSFFVDAVVGRLFHVVLYVHGAAEKNYYFHEEDAVYFVNLIDQLSATFQKLEQQGLPPKAVYIRWFLSKLKAEFV